jgi:glucose-6-phosphate isomerase
MRCRGPARRDVRGEPINTTEGRAVLHTALRAPRGAGPFSDEVHGVLDAMLAYAERVRDADRGSGSPTSSTSASAAATSARRWWCRRWTPCPPRAALHFVSNVDGHDIVPGAARAGRPAHAVHRRQQDLHHAGDDGQRGGGARLVPGQGGTDIAATSSPPPPTWRPRRPSASAPPSASGTGWAAAIRCGAPSACRSPSPSAPNFRALLAGAHAMDRHFARRRPAANLPLQLGLLDVWYRNFHRFTSRSVAPYHQGLRGCRPTCSSWRWKATASAWT